MTRRGHTVACDPFLLGDDYDCDADRRPVVVGPDKDPYLLLAPVRSVRENVRDRACWGKRRASASALVVAGPGAPDAGRGLQLYVPRLYLLSSRLVAHSLVPERLRDWLAASHFKSLRSDHENVVV
jgi:hypothetical protein